MFDFGINVIIGKHDSVEEYIRYKFEDDSFDIDYWCKGYAPKGQHYYRAGYCPVIWISRLPKNADEYATLAHEALHAVYRLFNWAGMPMDESTEEVATHAMSYIIREACKKQVD